MSAPRPSPFQPSRRLFLSDVGMGFTGLVLGALLQRDGIAALIPVDVGCRRMENRTSCRRRRT